MASISNAQMIPERLDSYKPIHTPQTLQSPERTGIPTITPEEATPKDGDRSRSFAFLTMLLSTCCTSRVERVYPTSQDDGFVSTGALDDTECMPRAERSSPERADICHDSNDREGEEEGRTLARRQLDPDPVMLLDDPLDDREADAPTRSRKAHPIAGLGVEYSTVTPAMITLLAEGA
jgi:hypothetical protein